MRMRLMKLLGGVGRSPVRLLLASILSAAYLVSREDVKAFNFQNLPCITKLLETQYK
ncbi:hypothetical protein HPP92_008822 [Vanilla planifolia]|uniref:Uncharacterized protein n=1 Tax=Vanilla planifolia TaxID=51239 RepID=A0A835V615_VANPL|nr:hypothetical protein HPP92_008822 [Vanilla planifolia]